MQARNTPLLQDHHRAGWTVIVGDNVLKGQLADAQDLLQTVITPKFCLDQEEWISYWKNSEKNIMVQCTSLQLYKFIGHELLRKYIHLAKKQDGSRKNHSAIKQAVGKTCSGKKESNDHSSRLIHNDVITGKYVWKLPYLSPCICISGTFKSLIQEISTIYRTSKDAHLRLILWFLPKV